MPTKPKRSLLLELILKAIGGGTILLTLLATCVAFLPVHGEYAPFPDDIKIDRLFTEADDELSKRGCLIALFSLESSIVKRLQQDGLRFLQPLTKGRSQTSATQLADWRIGPPPSDRSNDGNPVTAPRALTAARCIEYRPSVERAKFHEVMEAMNRGEAFYSTFHYGAGLIALAPGKALAVHIYRY